MAAIQETENKNHTKKEITKRAYIYKAFERFWHWSQALLIIFLMITGFEIHATYKLMGFKNAVMWHDIAAWALITLIIFSIFWHFATGAWKQYVPTMKLVKSQINYYILGIFKGAPHPTKKTSYNKFNPLQRLTYFGFKVFLIPLVVVSGILYMFYMYPENPVQIGSLYYIAIAHTFGAALLVMFLFVHLYLLTTAENPKESFAAMIHGWEEVTVTLEEEHKKHMQYAVDRSIAGYYRLDREAKFLDVNKAWMNLYKYTNIEDIIGKHVSISRKDEDVDKLNNLIAEVLKGNSIQGVFAERKCSDGTLGKHILSMNPTYENKKIVGVEGFIIDITDISMIEEQIFPSVKSSRSGYYRLNKKGYYEEVNDAWMKIYKYNDKNKIIGKHYSFNRTPEELKADDDIFTKVIKGETVENFIATRTFKDGTSARHILSAKPVKDNGKIVGLEGFILDISRENR